jgi:hypothetical protein
VKQVTKGVLLDVGCSILEVPRSRLLGVLVLGVVATEDGSSTAIKFQATGDPEQTKYLLQRGIHAVEEFNVEVPRAAEEGGPQGIPPGEEGGGVEEILRETFGDD